MKAMLSWLSAQPLAVKTTGEGAGGVSLAHRIAVEVDFQLSLAGGGEFEPP